MGVRTDIWVSAYLKRCNMAGLMCTVIRKGAVEAGTVFVCIRLDAARIRLLGPPAGPAFDGAGERKFEPRLDGLASQSEVDDYLARQIRFDPDVWIVEVEDRDGAGLLL